MPSGLALWPGRVAEFTETMISPSFNLVNSRFEGNRNHVDTSGWTGFDLWR